MTSYHHYSAPSHWTMPALPQPITNPASFDSKPYKRWLDGIDDLLNAQLICGKLGIQDVIYLRTHALDLLLTAVFDVLKLPHTLALFAIGGYGRGELFVYSDVDMLLLGDVDAHQSKIENFVSSLWDIGLLPAISVRSLNDTRVALGDHTIATALLEARFITGNKTLDGTPQNMVKQAWTIQDFYHAKMTESKERHLSHNATEYNLEPNIKMAWVGCAICTFCFGLANVILLTYVALVSSKNKDFCLIINMIPLSKHKIFCGKFATTYTR